jgi:hypothetical protein
MRSRRLVGLLAAAALVGLAGLATAAPTIDVLDSPDVTVANPPDSIQYDDKGNAEVNLDYRFSAEVRITNDGDPSQVNPEAIVYTNPDVEGCPQDERAFPAHLIVKTRKLEPNEQLRIGGAATPEAGGEAYWPMYVLQTYQDARTGNDVEIENGTYTLCPAVRVSGSDASCDKPEDQTCVVATDSFTTYIRRMNQAPEITSLEVSDEPVDPGDTVRFQADATDADTQPRPDDLVFRWSTTAFEDTGKTVTTSFPTEGEHTVALEVSDGFDTTTRNATIAVGDVGGSEDTSLAPGPGALAMVAALGAVAWLRRT